MDILCVISRWIIMCNIYVNYNRKPNKYFLFRWIRRTGNTCSPARQGWRDIDGLFVENRHLEMLLL